MALKISGFGVCNAGLVRKDNQDSIICDVKRLFFAVADGIGGGDGGAFASGKLCDNLASAELSGGMSRMRLAIASAIEKANEGIYSHAKSHGLTMVGTTVALLAVEGGDSRKAVVCHVGDSRVYRARGGRAELLTSDHTVGAELSNAFGNRRDVAGYALRSNRLAHVLTRAVGTDCTVKCDWKEVELAAGDVYLVCSDGVHDVVHDDEMAGLLKGGTPEETAKRISVEVERRGAPDNYSIVIAKVEEC